MASENADREGFLGSAAREWAARIRAENADWIAHAESLSRVGQGLLRVIKWRSGESQPMLVGLFFGRALSAFQAALILTERGMIAEARTIARSCLETAFCLNAAARDQEFVNELVAAEMAHKRIAARWLSNPNNAARQHLEGNTATEVDAFLEKVANQELQKLDLYRIARKAGMEDLYNLLYRLLSNDSAHPSIGSLERYVQLDHEGNATSFKWGPDFDNVHDSIMAACEAFLCSLKTALEMFGDYSLKEEFSSCLERHRELLEIETGSFPLDNAATV